MITLLDVARKRSQPSPIRFVEDANGWVHALTPDGTWCIGCGDYCLNGHHYPIFYGWWAD